MESRPGKECQTRRRVHLNSCSSGLVKDQSPTETRLALKLKGLRLGCVGATGGGFGDARPTGLSIMRVADGFPDAHCRAQSSASPDRRPVQANPRWLAV